MEKIRTELQKALALEECRKCGCMRFNLEAVEKRLASFDTESARELLDDVRRWRAQLEPEEYDCKDCAVCIPAEAWDAVVKAFPVACEAPG
ncbi:MAG: hypothetical protein GXO65_00590 [Euryarchaeota archaeon]|nr:hypothetical protein [Euryarchaeota archaeon]